MHIPVLKTDENRGRMRYCSTVHELVFFNSMHVTQLCKEILGSKSFDKGVSGN